MESKRPSVLEVNLKNFEYNVNQIQNFVGKEKTIMPVIKANAYGTYINKISSIINNFEIVAVANVDEAIELREDGVEKEIFVLNQPYKDEIENIIKNNITIGISSIEFLDELLKVKEKVKVHLEIETGMGRTGINLSELENYIDKVKQNSNIQIEGIYSHLSSADSDFDYTIKQLENFEKAVAISKEKIGELKYYHISASNGILNYNNNLYNIVRPGIILYGFESFEGALENIDLKPVCKLKSKITFIKEVEKDTSISYSRKYITTKKTKVATIPLGYADGISRKLSNRGYVFINGKKAPIIGNVCMDSFMIDVTDIEDASVGTDVYVWDNENITLEDVANLCDTINYEIMSTISERVPRKFVF